MSCMLHPQHDDHSEGHKNAPPAAPWYKTRSGIALLGFLVVAAYFLWTEHRAHVIAFLPYALFLLCPLMHIFHHRGHKHEDLVEKHDEPKDGFTGDQI